MTEETAKLTNKACALLQEINFLANTQLDRLEKAQDDGKHPDTFQLRLTGIGIQAFARELQELVE